MSQWNISDNVKKNVLKVAEDMENDMKILYIIRNLGPQRFTDLVENCDMSKSTVSKYLKLHLERNNIEKKLYSDEQTDGEEVRYFIMERGVELLNQDTTQEQQTDTLYINQVNETLTKLQNLIKFYKEIGVEESMIFEIVKLIINIGDKFFTLNQCRELYLALFYIINYNSILTPDYKLYIDQFCEVYDVKKLHIEYYIDKIMSADLGFFMFIRGKDVFFFHEQDILGTATGRLIKDRLIKEIIHINIIGYRKIYDFDEMAKEIADQLQEMGLIWFGIREEFIMLIERLIIKTAIEMGISKTFLMDIVVQSEKLSKTKKDNNALVNIIEGSDKYEHLNLVDVTTPEEDEDEFADEMKLDEILERGQGFCPNCGKIILKQDFSNRCSKCGYEFKQKELLKRFDAAKDAFSKFKQETLHEEEPVKCPNKECDASVLPSMEECPACHTKLDGLIKKNKKK
ncbi:MAG: ArsR family transcriptional regulator [Promethearchaeia archaeon]